MLLVRNLANQYVEIGPLRDSSGNPITSSASAFVNNSSSQGTLVHRSNGVWGYTFAQSETNQATQTVALRVQASGGAIAANFFCASVQGDGLLVVDAQGKLTGFPLTVGWIQDIDGNNRQFYGVTGASDDEAYKIDNRAIQAKTDLIGTSSGELAAEVSDTIKLKIASTKSKTVPATGNLTGKTLKLYIETLPGVFFAEITATGADGSFSFTPSSTLVEAARTFNAALREPSDGNNVLWSGTIEVAYAADAE